MGASLTLTQRADLVTKTAHYLDALLHATNGLLDAAIAEAEASDPTPEDYPLDMERDTVAAILGQLQQTLRAGIEHASGDVGRWNIRMGC